MQPVLGELRLHLPRGLGILFHVLLDVRDALLAEVARGVVARAAPFGAVDDDRGARDRTGLSRLRRSVRLGALRRGRRGGAGQRRPRLLPASNGNRFEVGAGHRAHRIGPVGTRLTQIHDRDAIAVRRLVLRGVDDAHRVASHERNVAYACLDMEVALVVDPREEQTLGVVLHRDGRLGWLARGGGRPAAAPAPSGVDGDDPERGPHRHGG